MMIMQSLSYIILLKQGGYELLLWKGDEINLVHGASRVGPKVKG